MSSPTIILGIIPGDTDKSIEVSLIVPFNLEKVGLDPFPGVSFKTMNFPLRTTQGSVVTKQVGFWTSKKESLKKDFQTMVPKGSRPTGKKSESLVLRVHYGCSVFIL